MKREDIIKAMSEYDIGEMIYLAENQDGESWRIDSRKGSYILREVKSVLSAFDEQKISDALWGTDISPSIMISKLDFPYVIIDRFCVLHERMAGTPITQPDPDNVRRMAFTLMRMQKYLSDAKLKLHSCGRKWLYDDMNEEKFVRMCSEYPEIRQLLADWKTIFEMDCDSSIPIHGNPGIWNMLADHGRIHIVDYRASRMGHPYRDPGVLLFSILEASESQQAYELFDAFMEGCAQAGCQLDLTLLEQAVDLHVISLVAEAYDYDNRVIMNESALKTLRLSREIFRNR